MTTTLETPPPLSRSRAADVFDPGNRSKGASIDDDDECERPAIGAVREERERPRRFGEGWRAPSRRVYLSSKQKMRARRRWNEESQQQQQQLWEEEEEEAQEKEKMEKEEQSYPSSCTKGCVHCLSSDRNTIFFRERLRRAVASLPFAIAL